MLTSVIFVTLIRGNYIDDFPGRNHTACLIQKLKYFTKALFNKEKNEWGYFFCRFEAVSFQFFTGAKYCFCHQAPIVKFTKHINPVSELCKYRLRTYCTIPWEKVSRENVLWVFTAIPVVTLSRKTALLDDFMQEEVSSLFLSQNSNTWPKLL